MKYFFTYRHRLLIIFLFAANVLFAQRSLLVNFGSNNCSSAEPWFSIIKNPLTTTPEALTNCSLVQQLPNFYAVFIAYNPKNNKIYVADVRSFTETKIWVLDIGLPGNIICPASIPVTPTYTYSYVSNNFEFDNNGDLWSLSNFNATTGQCNLDKFDVNTGTVINTRVIQFPVANIPTNITSGDITILPNGRMFVTLGSSPSQLYEIKNYVATTGAAATYLQTLPKNCYGIAYLNGILELTGADFTSSCYYFDYDIITGILGTEKVFQNGQSPVDNSSFTPSVGCSKRLLNSVNVNNNTADITYEIYTENLGNVILNNINLTDDLAKVYGAGNVSNVSVSFVNNFNLAGLTLNPAYNGTTVTSILSPGQNLPNNTSSVKDYYFKVQVKCRVTNLIPNITYLNSAIASADIGSNGGSTSLVNVSDSSINCDTGLNIVDPNQNGNASDPGENTPTPYIFKRPLPVHFIGIDATITNKTSAIVKWMIATPTINAATFEVEYSVDGIKWASLGNINIADANRGSYQFTHVNIPTGNLYYRIKQTDKDGQFIYSRVVLLQNKSTKGGYVIYPNPASNFIAISRGPVNNTTLKIQLYDAIGRKLLDKIITASSEEINVAQISSGTYLLRMIQNNEVYTQKIIVKH